MHHALVIVAKNTKSVAYLKPNQCFTTLWVCNAQPQQEPRSTNDSLRFAYLLLAHPSTKKTNYERILRFYI